MRRILWLTGVIVVVMVLLACNNSTANGELDEKTVIREHRKAIKKLGEIPDFFKDPRLMVDDTKFYVWDRLLCKVCIYSKSDLKKLSEFGGKGDGPQEFNSVIHAAGLAGDTIYLNSSSKLNFYTNEGVFIRSVKGDMKVYKCKPVGNNIVGYFPGTQPHSKKARVTYILFDNTLKKIKNLIELEAMKEKVGLTPQKKGLMAITDCYKSVVYKDRIYVAGTGRGFYFAVFNAEGNMLYEIRKDYKRKKIEEWHRKFLLNHLKRNDRRGWNKMTAEFEIVFPEYLPAYANFAIDNDMIYVFEYPGTRKPLLDVSIFNLEGKLLRKSSIPSLYLVAVLIDKLYIFNGMVYFPEILTKGDRETIGIFKFAITGENKMPLTSSDSG